MSHDHEKRGSAQGEERALRELLDEAAALPREIQPPRDLWPGIDARLEARPAHGGPRAATRAWRRRAWAVQALAALLFLALGVVLGTVWSQGGAASPRPGPAPVEAVGERVPASTFLEAEALYLRTKERLWLAAYERRQELSPVTRTVVERNLRILDEAIREIEHALAEDPGNLELQERLLTRHRQEVALLQRLVQPAGEV